MKKILFLLLIFPAIVFGQAPGRLNYKSVIQSYNGDSAVTSFSGDSVKHHTNKLFNIFDKPVKVNKDTLETKKDMRAYVLTHSGGGSTGFSYTKTLDSAVNWILPNDYYLNFGNLDQNYGLIISKSEQTGSVYLSSRNFDNNIYTSLSANSNNLDLSANGVISSLSLDLDSSKLYVTNYDTTKCIDNSLTTYRMLKNAVANSGGVPTSRTLSINGTTYDLSANRSWTIAAGADSTKLKSIYQSSLDTTKLHNQIITKQPQLSGTGFVKATGTTISYDNSTYLTTTGSGSTLTGITANQVSALAKSTTTDATPDSVWTVVNGQANRAAVTSIPYGYYTNVNASGTVYTLTATSALVDFGTTDPAVTISQAGTWKICTGVYVHYAGATYTGGQTISFKLRRSNNTAADVTASAIPTFGLSTVTTYTGGDFFIQLPPVWYSTSNTSDLIQVWGNVSALPSAGTMTVTGVFVTAEKIYD